MKQEIVLRLISKKDYEAMYYLCRLISLYDIKTPEIRNREISDKRKSIVKAVTDKFPDFPIKYIARELKCSENGVYEQKKQANILYSNDSNFARNHDNLIQ